MCASRSRNPRRGDSGQALVEFALVSTLFLLLLAGAVDFGLLFSDRLEVSNATRVGVRWASEHPSSWSNNASPADSSIEGQIIYAGDTRNIPNDDSHIQIKYYAVSGTTMTYCGTYVAATPAFVTAVGYTQNTCVIPGSVITVTVSYQYAPLTPLIKNAFGSAITVTSSAAMVEVW